MSFTLILLRLSTLSPTIICVQVKTLKTGCMEKQVRKKLVGQLGS